MGESLLQLSVRHVLHEPNPPHLPYREEHFGYVHLPVSIPPEQAALVLVDCWDRIIVESFQERAERICETTIRPVLEASRSVGMTVVHAPSPPVAEKFQPVPAGGRGGRGSATREIRCRIGRPPLSLIAKGIGRTCRPGAAACTRSSLTASTATAPSIRRCCRRQATS